MTERNKYIVRVVIILAIIISIIISSIFFLSKYIKKSIHEERVIYLTAQTETTRGLINNILDEYMTYARMSVNMVNSYKEDADDISSFITLLNSNLDIADGRLILVDSACTWYGENGTYGKITDVASYEESTKDELVYITTGVDVTIESLCFRIKLKEPIITHFNGNEIKLTHATVIYYMDSFKEAVQIAFPYSCNSFICDNSGLMLYKDFTMGTLISGSNILRKYERVEFLYGDTNLDQIVSIKNGFTTVGEMNIDGSEFFICTASLNVNNWITSFIMPSDELSAGKYISTVSKFILVFGIVLSLVLIALSLYVFRANLNRKLLDKEKLANVYLEKASKAKTEFLSNMSHDIRTPINGIMGMTKLCKMEDDPSKINDYLDKIDLSSKYLLSLVNDVLDMGTIESGNLKIDHHEVNLISTADNAINLIRAQASERQLNIVSIFNDIRHNFILSDDVRLNQIFINILGNSLKFTPDKGTISFTIKELSSNNGKSNYEFVFTDTGIGMSEEFLKTIWDRYAQEKSKQGSKYKGTGLGMAITKKLVDEMGGTIDVTSKENEGTTFRINLSFDITEAKDSEEEKAIETLKNCNILVTEDNEINMEIAYEILSSFDANVVKAWNGKEALDIFEKSKENEFDIILMDMRMPIMDGLEATRRIRALDRQDAKVIPILAMTANTTAEDTKMVKEAGMDEHLSKPLNVSLLIKTINYYMNGGK